MPQVPQVPQVRFISPPTLSRPPGYSQVVHVSGGSTVYVAGQDALDVSGKLVGTGDFRAQAEQVFSNLQAALASVGADFSSLVKLTIYVLDHTNLPLLREVRDRYVNTAAPPASTLVEVRSLAHDDFLLEVDAIASLPAA